VAQLMICHYGLDQVFPAFEVCQIVMIVFEAFTFVQ